MTLSSPFQKVGSETSKEIMQSLIGGEDEEVIEGTAFLMTPELEYATIAIFNKDGHDGKAERLIENIFMVWDTMGVQTYMFKYDVDEKGRKILEGGLLSDPEDLNILDLSSIHFQAENFVKVSDGDGKAIEKVSELKTNIENEIKEDISPFMKRLPMATEPEDTKTELNYIYARLQRDGITIENELDNAQRKYNKMIGELVEAGRKEKPIKKEKEETPKRENLKAEKIPSSPDANNKGVNKEAMPTEKSPTEIPSSFSYAHAVIPSDEYEKKIDEEVFTVNMACKKRNAEVIEDFMNTNEYDPDDEIQKIVLTSLGSEGGEQVGLCGPAGAGKTYTVETVSKGRFDFLDVKLTSADDPDTLKGTLAFREDHLSEDGSQKMGFDYGKLIQSAIACKENLRANPGNPKAVVMFLDEVDKIDNTDVFTMLDGSKPEYSFDTDETLEYCLIKTENAGNVWMQLSNKTDRERERYVITEDGKLHIEDSEDAARYIFGGSEQEAKQRGNRDDLFTIKSNNLKKVYSSVLLETEGKRVIKVPKNLLKVVFALNKKDDLEPYFRSRIKLINVKVPSISKAVDRVMNKKEILAKDWDKEERKEISDIAKNFFYTVKERIENNEDFEASMVGCSPRKISELIEGISSKDPFGHPLHNMRDKLMQTEGSFYSDSIDDEEVSRVISSIVVTSIDGHRPDIEKREKKAELKAIEIKNKAIDATVVAMKGMGRNG